MINVKGNRSWLNFQCWLVFFKWKCAGPFFSGVGASMQMRCLDVVHAYFRCGLSKGLLMYKCHWHTGIQSSKHFYWITSKMCRIKSSVMGPQWAPLSVMVAPKRCLGFCTSWIWCNELIGSWCGGDICTLYSMLIVCGLLLKVWCAYGLYKFV